VLLDDTAAMVAARGGDVRDLPGFEAGGPRRKIFFDPSKTRVGIVTCGGLCPGLNNVIRGLVMELTRHYGVRRIVGFRTGYQGSIARYGHPVMDYVLIPEVPFALDGEEGLLAHLRRMVARRGHAVIVVAEGAGQASCIPIHIAISTRNTVDPDGDLWLSVLESTGQPARWGPRPVQL
jgi:6-phosphofructokinase